MTWQIRSFDGMGPVRFGMTIADVAVVLGAPDRSRKGLRPGSLAEFRGNRAPIIRYMDERVSEIEAFYDLPEVSYQGTLLFEEAGLEVMRVLERLNGGALENLGIVVFEKLGISSGRLDTPGREQHSVTAFRQGLWTNRTTQLKPVSFV